MADKTFAALPAAAALGDADIIPLMQAGVTTRTTFGAFRSGLVGTGLPWFDVTAQSGWDPNAAANDGALTAAIAACIAAGGGTVLLPRLLKLAAAHDVASSPLVPVNLIGLGSGQGVGASEVLATNAAMSLIFGGSTVGSVGGISGGFHINANNLATVPFKVGIAVGRTFQNIDVSNSAGTGLLLQGTQNSTFNEVNIQGSATDGVQLDRCAGNAFYKCEFGSSSRYNGNLVSNGGALAGTVDYPLSNAFRDCLFEYHTATTIAMLHQGAGIDNLFDNCQFATSSTPTTSATKLIILEKSGTPFSTDLRLRDCVLVHNFTAGNTVAVDIVGAQSRVLGTGFQKITGANIGIQRLDNTGGAISYFDKVIVTAVTTNKVTGAGTAGWVDATFM